MHLTAITNHLAHAQMCREKQLQQSVVRDFCGSVDRYLGRFASRAAICRRVELDPSTIWRALKSGAMRLSNLRDYTGGAVAMRREKLPDGDLASPVGRTLIAEVAEWAAKPDGAPAPEAALAQLTVLAGDQAYRRRYGAAGTAFVELANLRAAQGGLPLAWHCALGGLSLALLDDAA